MKDRFLFNRKTGVSGFTGFTLLGQGGGFYDRALANCKQRPYRLGLAFDCQYTAHIPIEEWDQRQHAVLTETGLRICAS